MPDVQKRLRQSPLVHNQCCFGQRPSDGHLNASVPDLPGRLTPFQYSGDHLCREAHAGHLPAAQEFSAGSGDSVDPYLAGGAAVADSLYCNMHFLRVLPPDVRDD